MDYLILCAIKHTETRVSHRQMYGDKLCHRAFEGIFIAAYSVLISALWMHAEFGGDICSNVAVDVVVAV
jgi:hypothetical protein